MSAEHTTPGTSDAAAGERLGACAADWAVARRARVDAAEVRYREAGDGPPVVLVHGLGASADYWIRNGPPLAAEGFRVLAPDLPGFGRTPGPGGGLSVPEQAAALARWADTLGLGPAVYVGHSLGCQSALELAAREPARARALVLVAPTGAPGWRRPRQAWALFRDAWREPWTLLTTVGWAYLQAGPRRVWHTWRRGARHEPLVLLPQVRAPGLVVVGTSDPVVERRFAEELAEALPQGRLLWLEGATHAAQFSCAEAFNRELLRFLNGLPDPPPAAPPRPRRAGGRGSRGGR